MTESGRLSPSPSESITVSISIAISRRTIANQENDNSIFESMTMEELQVILQETKGDELLAFQDHGQQSKEALGVHWRTLKELDVSASYRMTQDHFEFFTENLDVNTDIRSINFNFCYWVTREILDRVFRFENLVELHVIDISIRSCHIKALLNSNTIKVLSFSWTKTWDTVIETREEKYVALPLFKTLEKLIISIDGYKYNKVIKRINRHILDFCDNLEELTIYEPALTKTDPDLYPTQQQFQNLSRDDDWTSELKLPQNANILLPKLKRLTLDLADVTKNYEGIYRLLQRVMRCKRQLLDQLFVGRRASSMAFHKEGLITRKVNPDELVNICLDGLPNSPYKTDACTYAIWIRPTNDCQNLWVENVYIGGCPSKYNYKAFQCPNLTFASFDGTLLHDHLLPSIMEEFTTLYTNLHTLILTTSNEWPTTFRMEVLTSLIHLKKLHLSRDLVLINKRDLPRFQLFFPHEEPYSGWRKNINNYHLREEPIFTVTEHCPLVEDFGLIGDSWETDPENVVSPLFLASISNWPKLKHLYLINIHTGTHNCSFLKFITKVCPYLTTLHVKIFSDKIDYFLIQSLEFCPSLRDLVILQEIPLTEEFGNVIFKLPKLERFFLHKLKIPTPSVPDFSRPSVEERTFMESLVSRPNITLIIIEILDNPILGRKHFAQMFFKLYIKRLLQLRPAFLYYLNEMVGEICNLPQIHQPLVRYALNSSFFNTYRMMEHHFIKSNLE